MEIRSFFYNNDSSINIILGQTHFIKSVSDLAEIIACTVPQVKFAVAFCEASGPCLIRYESNDKELEQKAIDFLNNIKAGHSFIIMLKNAYPINVLNKIKMCDEVCRIFCATANPITVLTVENDKGAGIIGVIDGESPKGVETEEDKVKRKEFLKKIGYKY